MTSGAKTVLECNALQLLLAGSHKDSRDSTYGSRVDSNTVVLIVNFRTVDYNIVAGANIKAIGIVAKAAGISSGVVNGHAGNGQSITASNTDSLMRSVQDREASNSGGREAVEIQELRSLASV